MTTSPSFVRARSVNTLPVDDKSLLSRVLDFTVGRDIEAPCPVEASPCGPDGRGNVGRDLGGAGRVHLQVVQNAPLEKAALPLPTAVRSAVDHDVSDDGDDDDDDNKDWSHTLVYRPDASGYLS